jgi:hypothetical protein
MPKRPNNFLIAWPVGFEDFKSKLIYKYCSPLKQIKGGWVFVLRKMNHIKKNLEHFHTQFGYE